MGEIADAIIDRMIFGPSPRKEKRKSYQRGVGDFKWRTSAGGTMNMRAMDNNHIRNALAICERTNNTAKAAQLMQVLRERGVTSS